jgi:hypothetical protein
MVGGRLDSWISEAGAIDRGAASLAATRPHYS